MVDRELTGDEAQRALSEAMRRTRATVPSGHGEGRTLAERIAAKLLKRMQKTASGITVTFDALHVTEVIEAELLTGAPSSVAPSVDMRDRLLAEADSLSRAYGSGPVADLLREAASSVATGAGPDVLTVKELHDRANVCTRNAYQHRQDGQEMSAQFHLGAAMAFRDMADKLSSAPVPLPDAAPSPDFKALYYELLLAVGHKYPGESRHETAMRYIRRAEQSGGPVSLASPPEKEPTDA